MRMSQWESECVCAYESVGGCVWELMDEQLAFFPLTIMLKLRLPTAVLQHVVVHEWVLAWACDCTCMCACIRVCVVCVCVCARARARDASLTGTTEILRK